MERHKPERPDHDVKLTVAHVEQGYAGSEEIEETDNSPAELPEESQINQTEEK